jgi:hypothetical protein
MVSRSNLRRIEPLRKHTQLSASDGLARPHEHGHACRPCSLRKECCVGSTTEAGRVSAWRWPRMRLSHLRPVGKGVCRYRGTTDRVLLRHRRGHEGATTRLWGGAAIVLRARESRAHGEGRQWWRVCFGRRRELDP